MSRYRVLSTLAVPLRDQYMKKLTDVATDAGSSPMLGNFILNCLRLQLTNPEIMNNFERLRTTPRLTEDSTFLRGGVSFIELMTQREEQSMWPLRNHGLTLSASPLFPRHGRVSGADMGDLRSELGGLLFSIVRVIKNQETSVLARFMSYPDLGDWLAQQITRNVSGYFPSPAQVSDFFFPRDAEGQILGQPLTDDRVMYIVKKVLCACKSVGAGAVRTFWSPISAIMNIRTTTVGLQNLVYRFCLIFKGDYSVVTDIVDAAKDYWNRQPIEFCTEILLNLAFLYTTAVRPVPAISASTVTSPVAATNTALRSGAIGTVASNAFSTGGTLSMSAAPGTARLANTLPPAPDTRSAPPAPLAAPVAETTDLEAGVSIAGDGPVTAIREVTNPDLTAVPALASTSEQQPNPLPPAPAETQANSPPSPGYFPQAAADPVVDGVVFFHDADLPVDSQTADIPAVLDALYLTVATADPALASLVRSTVISRGVRQHIDEAVNGTTRP
jgi:hypothetical protein